MKKKLILYFQKQLSWIKEILFKHYIIGLYKRIGEHHILLLAGGLAFSFFVCIIPLVLILFSIIGNIFAFTTLENKISLLAEKIIPYRDYADYAKRIVFSRVEEFKIYRNIAGLFGIFGLFLGASSVFSTMKTILNTIFNFEKRKNPILSKLKDFGMVLFILFFSIISTTLLPILEIIKNFWDKIAFLKFLRLSIILKFLFSLGSVFLIFSLLFVLYYLIPSERIPKRVAVLSSFLATTFWVVAVQLFGFYITNFHTLGKIYGTYILMIVLAFWIYYSSAIFIIGAEVGDLYWQREKNYERSVFSNQYSVISIQ